MDKIQELKQAKAKRAKILKLRASHTLAELAKMFGVSTARISQQIKKAKEERNKI